MTYSPLVIKKVEIFQPNNTPKLNRAAGFGESTRFSGFASILDPLLDLQSFQSGSAHCLGGRTFPSQLNQKTRALYQAVREFAFSNGLYVSVDPFSDLPIKFAVELLAVCEVSYRGFNEKILIVKPPPSHVTAIAESSVFSTVFYAGAIPDFLIPIDSSKDCFSHPSLLVFDSSYFDFSSADALVELDKLGINKVLFVHYIVHELRHRIEMNFESDRSGFGGIAIHEASAYLSMVVDGPNTIYPILRMCSLCDLRASDDPHRQGSLVAFDYLLNLMGVVMEEDSQFVFSDFLQMPPDSLRRLSFGALQTLYVEKYGGQFSLS